MTSKPAKKESTEPVKKPAVKKRVISETEIVNARGRMRVREGVVVSDKMDKTRVVAVTRLFPHPLYKKVVKEVKKVYVHDEKNVSKTGDKVKIIETRPMSKLKRFKLVEVLSQ